jgi:K+-transporting ATPase ATPase C chain
VIRIAVRALIATVVLVVLTGIAYPLVATGFAQLVLPNKADGSIVTENGRPIGSTLIGQQWKGPQWFYGRPSAVEYDASTSSGSNLGPHSKELAKEISQRVAAVLALERPYNSNLTASQIPADLVTASGSGLDPNISPAAAAFEAPRISAVRRLPLSTVRSLIDANTSGRTLGFLGEPRVNVFDLNLALQGAQS